MQHIVKVYMLQPSYILLLRLHKEPIKNRLTMTEKETLIKEIESFCSRYGVKPSSFGRAALNNPNFLSDLKVETFSPKLSTVTRVRHWMKNQEKTRLNKRRNLEEML